MSSQDEEIALDDTMFILSTFRREYRDVLEEDATKTAVLVGILSTLRGIEYALSQVAQK